MAADEIIDPHHHLWDLENYAYPWLCQTGEPVAPIAGSLRPIMKSYLQDDYNEDARRWNVVKDVHIVPIRLRPTPTTSRMLPLA
jgi:predicted TIM-barrel fold metal-dependent hydrolase